MTAPDMYAIIRMLTPEGFAQEEGMRRTTVFADDEVLDSLLEGASAFIEREFSLEMGDCRLRIYSAEDWSRFCGANGFDERSEGIYVPRSYTAYARADSEALIPTIFHEYFGHGLFCEQSSIGRTLVEIGQEGGDAHSYLYGEVNQATQSLGLMRRNIDTYEGFALWMEALLCEETGHGEAWDRARERLTDEDTLRYGGFTQAERKLTRPGLMAQLGFPREYCG